MEQTEKNIEEVSTPFQRFLDQLSDMLGKIGGIATLLMVILVTFNVITRKVFNWSIPGFYELLGLIGAIFYSFGIVYGATRGQHIVMDMVINRLPQKARKVCDWLNRILMLVFCGLLIYAGTTVTLGMLSETTEDLSIPVAPFRFIVVAAFLLLALIILAGKNIGKAGE